MKAKLTPTEVRVLTHIGMGFSTKQIAAILARSVKTAERHRTNLQKKINSHDVATTVRYAIENGYVPVDIKRNHPRSTYSAN